MDAAPLVTCGWIKPDAQRCGKAAAPGQHRCHEHNAEYQRLYGHLVMTMAIRRAKRNGKRAMQLVAIDLMEQLGSAEISGLAAAEMLRKVGLD